MKTQNPPKKLTLIKRTIAHLNFKQMRAAVGGVDLVSIDCENTTGGKPSVDICQNFVATGNCDTVYSCLVVVND